jgi:ABC-type dipeptide/oligopeptide/nickel transport system permease component
MRSRSDYILRRTAAAVGTVFVAVSMNFLLFRILPGSAAVSMAHVPGAGPGLRQALTQEFGLNHSLWVQYVLYLWQLVHLNLGVSFYYHQPVLGLLLSDLANTIPLVVLGTVFSILLGVLTGVVGAWLRGSVFEHLSVVPALAFYATPVQWLGLMLIIVFGSVLPTSGRSNPFLFNPTFIQQTESVLTHLILPSLTLGLVLYGQYTLIVRSAMLETLCEDYVLTAKAVGYTKARILRVYALRNGILPVISVIALSAGFIVGGAILVETVFNYPGVGLAVYNAILNRDYPMLQGAFLILTVSVVICNLVADVIYFRLDPRIS